MHLVASCVVVPTQVLAKGSAVEVYTVGDTIGVGAISEVDDETSFFLSITTYGAEYIAMSLDSSSVRRLGVFGCICISA